MDRYRVVDTLSPWSSWQSIAFIQSNWKLFGNTVDRLRPVNSFIHHRHPRTLLSHPSAFLSLFSRRSAALASARALPFPKRRLSGVRSANKSNTPRFVQRESSSFTIHEFIMGTTEDTAGSLLLIYRYASLATNGPRLLWCTLLAVADARKLSSPP